MRIMKVTAVEVHLALSEAIELFSGATKDLLDDRYPEGAVKLIQGRALICKLLGADVVPPGIEETSIGTQSLMRAAYQLFRETAALHEAFTIALEATGPSGTPEAAGEAWYEDATIQKRLKCLHMQLDGLAASSGIRRHCPQAEFHRN